MSYELDVKELLGKILNSIYPVGSIYISTVATSPATLIGGTWEPIHGRFLVAEGYNGAGGNQALNLSAGSTGGESRHQLTINEVPSHRHRLVERQRWYDNDILARDKYNGIYQWIEGRTTYPYKTNPNKFPFYDTDAIGGDGTHENLPPYLAVYMWRRTA